MAFQIRINPQALRAVAQRRVKVRETVEESSEKLIQMRERLNAAWDGNASDDALQALDELINAIRGMTDGTQSTADLLSGIAGIFEELDEHFEAGPFAVARIVPIHDILRIPVRPNILLRLLNSLRIIPDEVRVSADMGREVANSLMEVNAELLNQIQSLEEVWEGRSFDRFSEESRELAEGFREVSEALDELCRKLHNAADVYEKIDSQMWN